MRIKRSILWMVALMSLLVGSVSIATAQDVTPPPRKNC